jgi:hypothetical protein
MRIGSSSPANLEQLPAEAQIDAELMAKAAEQNRIEGDAAVRLIESATAGVNVPLTEGSVGRRINIRI